MHLPQFDQCSADTLRLPIYAFASPFPAGTSCYEQFQPVWQMLALLDWYALASLHRTAFKRSLCKQKVPGA